MHFTMKSSSKTNLTILFFGLGSIGSRLARIIQNSYEYNLFAFRFHKKGINDLGIEEIYDSRQVDKISPDIAFITNPTSLHMETAIRSAALGRHLFIEKPLSHNLEGYDSLLKETREKGVLTYVACHLRFDPIIQHLKKFLAAHHDCFYSRVVCSSYLPAWRPEQDYRESYSSKSAMGGGVLLDLIHEPDYCHYLFGPIDSINGYAGNRSVLEIDSEDIADLIIHHSSGFISSIHLDYFGVRQERKLDIFGNNLHVEADLLKRTLTTVNPDGREMEKFPPINRDSLYEAELGYFFQCIQDKRSPMNNIEEHMTVLRPILEFKRGLEL